MPGSIELNRTMNGNPGAGQKWAWLAKIGSGGVKIFFGQTVPENIRIRNPESWEIQESCDIGSFRSWCRTAYYEAFMEVSGGQKPIDAVGLWEEAVNLFDNLKAALADYNINWEGEGTDRSAALPNGKVLTEPQIRKFLDTAIASLRLNLTDIENSAREDAAKDAKNLEARKSFIDRFNAVYKNFALNKSIQNKYQGSQYEVQYYIRNGFKDVLRSKIIYVDSLEEISPLDIPGMSWIESKYAPSNALKGFANRGYGIESFAPVILVKELHERSRGWYTYTEDGEWIQDPDLKDGVSLGDTLQSVTANMDDFDINN